MSFTGAYICLLHVCSTLQCFHGNIKGYRTGSPEKPVPASNHAMHMKEAKQWNSAFRPFYVMGSMPSEFQGSLQLPLQHFILLPRTAALLWPPALIHMHVAHACRSMDLSL